MPRSGPSLPCPHCAYDLTGIDPDEGLIVCPECGRECEPGLLRAFERVSDRRLVIRMLAPFAACLAFFVLVQGAVRLLNASNMESGCVLLPLVVAIWLLGPSFAILGPTLTSQGRMRRARDWTICYLWAVGGSAGLGALAIAIGRWLNF